MSDDRLCPQPDLSAPPPPPFPDPIAGVIPFATLTIFAGAPGAGKTTLLVDWLHRWRADQTICRHRTAPPTWFYWISADRGQTESEFYAKIGFRDRITYYSVVSGASGINTEDFHKDANGRALFQHCMAVLNPIPGSHVIIDPIGPLFITGNQNRARDVAASLISMSRCIEERQINITGTAHFSKQKADPNDRYRRPQDRISGSGAWSGFSDTQMYIVDPEPPNRNYHQFGWNPRNLPPEDFKFERTARGFVPHAGLDEIGTTVDNDRPSQLYALIPELGILTKDLELLAVMQFAISRATFYRDIETLKERYLIYRDDQTGKLYRRDLQ